MRASILAALLLCACMPPAQTRVGLVDGARLVRVSKLGKEIRKKVEQEGNRLTAELEALQKKAQTLATEVADLDKKGPKGSPAIAAKRKALHKARLALRETHARYRKQLNAYGARLLKEFKERVRKVVMRLRSEKGLDLVLMTSRGEEQGLWIFPVVDITDEVVKRMDGEE